MNKPQSFSELIDGWAQGLASWWVQSLAPILTVIVSGMDAYVDSRARAIANEIVKESIANHRRNMWHLGPDGKERNE